MTARPNGLQRRGTATNVRIAISRRGGASLIAQIHDQVIAAISSGDLKPGDRLPTIRDLAGFLGINRNTVAQSYRLLEAGGYVTTRAGGGTLVAEGPATEVAIRGQKLRDAVRSALRGAVEAGFAAEEFGRLAYYEAMRWESTYRPSVLVIHQYPHELEFLRKILADELPVAVQSMLLDEVTAIVEGEGWQRLAAPDFAVVPVHLLQDVTTLLREASFPVLGLGIGLSLKTLIEIADRAKSARVTIVCTDPSGVSCMDDALRSAGVGLTEVWKVTHDDPELERAIEWAQVVVASNASVDRVADLVNDRPLIRYSAMMSEASLATIRSYVDHVIHNQGTAQ